jgi:hypothetical protein
MPRSELPPDVQKLFEELIELDWPARRARLGATRADDAELALCVERLLRAADEAQAQGSQPARPTNQ